MVNCKSIYYFPSSHWKGDYKVSPVICIIRLSYVTWPTDIENVQALHCYLLIKHVELLIKFCTVINLFIIIQAQ